MIWIITYYIAAVAFSLFVIAWDEGRLIIRDFLVVMTFGWILFPFAGVAHFIFWSNDKRFFNIVVWRKKGGKS